MQFTRISAVIIIGEKIWLIHSAATITLMTMASSDDFKTVADGSNDNQTFSYINYPIKEKERKIWIEKKWNCDERIHSTEKEPPRKIWLCKAATEYLGT